MQECPHTTVELNCTCSYEPCSRKGKCCECVVKHRQSGEIPACFFSLEAEMTHDRSISNFIRDNS